jgi:hypothetical protein
LTWLENQKAAAFFETPHFKKELATPHEKWT